MTTESTLEAAPEVVAAEAEEPQEQDAAAAAAPTLPDATPADAASDTGTDSPTATADEPASDDANDDPVEAAIAARLALEQERMREAIAKQVRTEFETTRAEQERRQREAQQQDQLRAGFVNAIRDAYGTLRSVKFHDADGNEVTVDDNTFQRAVVEPFQRYNSTVKQAVHSEVLTQLAETALESLPDDEARTAFTSAAAAKPLDEWLRTYAETAAPKSKYVADMQREMDAKLKAAEARGYARGQKAPPAAPRQGTERTANTPQLDLSTHSGLATALAKNLITQAEYLDKRRALDG